MAFYDDATALGFDIDVSSGDMSLDSSGDIAKVFGSDLVNQRLYIVSMVEPGTLLFHPDVGIGLPSRVGQTITDDASYNIASLVSVAYAQDPAVVSVVSVSVTTPQRGLMVIQPTIILVGGAISTAQLSIPVGG